MIQDQTPSSGKNLPEQTEEAIGYPVLSLDDIKAVAPVNRLGKPDLYNHMPSRLISEEEAAFRKWGYFYMAAPCRYGHVAPRYTSNPRLCVDCARLKAGKTVIGEKTGLAKSAFRQNHGHGVVVKVDKPQEVDAWERRFLEAYAFHKEFKTACETVGVTEAQIESRMAWSDPFRRAYELLEGRLGITKIPEQVMFIWTKEKRDRLIEVYVDHGSMSMARDAIQVTPSEFFREIARNPSFAEQIKEADPLAHLALEERAIQLALAGNDKLLSKILAVKKPEYRDNLKVDMLVTEKLDDRQLQARLSRLLSKLSPEVIEGSYTEIAETRAIAAPGDTGGTGS